MTLTDLPLFATQPAPATPPPNPELTAVLLELRQGNWLTARTLRHRLGYSDRTLRAVAEASDGQIISGQQGYKLTRCATSDEITHAANWLHSQAQKMENRSIAIRRRAIGNLTGRN